MFLLRGIYAKFCKKKASLIFQDNFFLPLDGAGRRNLKLLSMEFQCSVLVRHVSSLMKSQGMPGLFTEQHHSEKQIMFWCRTAFPVTATARSTVQGWAPRAHSASASSAFHSTCCHLGALFPLYKQSHRTQAIWQRHQTFDKVDLTKLDSREISSPQFSHVACARKSKQTCNIWLDSKNNHFVC